MRNNSFVVISQRLNTIFKVKRFKINAVPHTFNLTYGKFFCIFKFGRTYENFFRVFELTETACVIGVQVSQNYKINVTRRNSDFFQAVQRLIHLSGVQWNKPKRATKFCFCARKVKANLIETEKDFFRYLWTATRKIHKLFLRNKKIGQKYSPTAKLLI